MNDEVMMNIKSIIHPLIQKKNISYILKRANQEIGKIH